MADYNPILTQYDDRIKDLTDKTNAAMTGIESDLEGKQAVINTLNTTVSTHTADNAAHGATIIATANRLIVRDGSGRAKIATPVTSDDIATKGIVDAVQQNLTAHSNITTGAHGAAIIATPGAIIQRDSSGRAKVAAPSAADDIARKDTVDAVQTNLTTHNNNASAHGATSAATPNAIIQRDASGRAKVAVPNAADDIARKDTVDAVNNALQTHMTDAGAHSATPNATPNTFIRRDINGRAKVSAPSATDDIATLANVQAAISASAPAGFGLGSVAASANTNWDNYITTGFYMGSGLLNAPTGVVGMNTWFWVVVIGHNNLYAVQMAFDFNGLGMFVRTLTNNAWGLWKQVARSGDVHGNLTIGGRLDLETAGGSLVIPVE